MVSTLSCTTDDAQRRTAPLPALSSNMASAVRNCVQLLNLPLAEALRRLASVSPATFLGVDDWLGWLAPGYRADMVALEPHSIEVIDTWVAGQSAVE